MNSEADRAPYRRVQAAIPYALVLAVGVLLYYNADNFEFEQASGRVGPGAWPKLILILMLATAVWGLVSSAIKSAGTQQARADDAEEIVRPPEIYPVRVWLAVASTIGYLFLLPILGFFISTVIFCAGLMYLGQFRRPLSVALVSVALGLSFLFIFMRVVYVALPVGIAPFDYVSYALMSAMGVH